MLKKVICASAVVCVCWLALDSAAAQQPQQTAGPARESAAAVAEPEAPRVVLQAESTASVLRLMKFSGLLRDAAGNARTGAAGLTFALYKDQQGGSPLWLEVQNAQLDEQGRYTVLLGSTKNEGLPLELFSTGEARWLGVQLNLPGEEEQPRVLLVSVPYALKAADAEMLGGKPPSAFLLAEKAESGEKAEAKPGAGKEAVKEGPGREQVVGTITGEGTTNMVSKFTGANTIGNGSIFDNGFVGIGTTSPSARLHIFEPEPSQNANVRLMGSGQTGSWMDIFAGTAVGFGLFGYGAQPFIFGTSAVERMRITPTGNVGVGTTSPNAKLSVGSGSIADPNMQVQISTAGTGTVNYYGANKDGGYGLLLGYENAGFLGTGGVVRMVSADPLLFFVNNTTEAMRLTSAGNVGIGTAAPAEKLEVAGNVKASASNATQVLSITQNGSGAAGLFQNNGGGPVLSAKAIGVDVFKVNGTTGDTTAFFNLGVGTATPLTNLDVFANNNHVLVGHLGCNSPFVGIALGNTGCTNYSLLGDGSNTMINRPSGGGIFFREGNAEQMVIAAGGSVGIGTTSPGAKLDVVAGGSTDGGRFQSASTSGKGVFGWSTASTGSPSGVVGQSDSTNGKGVYGNATATSGFTYGVFGLSASTGGTGVFGRASAGSGTTYGVYGETNSASGYGVYSAGDAHVQGTLSKSGGSFKIDHPADPANKYLSHSFVESPDMMNIYNGVATLDARGQAWINLPDWFEVLNRDFRYQLTAIGAPAPRLHIAREVSGNRFQIAGGQPGLKVSWQVTGIRQDAYAQAHRIPVEEEKPEGQRGYYLHPELFGQPAERGIHWSGNKKPLRDLEEDRRGALATAQRPGR